MEAEQAYLRWAQTSVEHALDAERPSQHVLSALTLLELAKMFDGREDGTLAGLAHRLSELITGVHPGISAVRQSLYARCGTIWPPAQPPIGASAHADVSKDRFLQARAILPAGLSSSARLVDLVAFTTLHFMGLIQGTASTEVRHG